jgi:hypothetical protein
MKKLKIAFDIDGVLANFNDSWATMMKEDFDKVPNRPIVWDLEKTWDLSLKEVIKSFQKFTSEARWLDMDVDLGWFRILNDLHRQGHELDLVTFRGTHTSDPQDMKDDIQAQTIAWAERKGITPLINNIHFESQKTKFIIMDGYDLLIDDCPAIYHNIPDIYEAVSIDDFYTFRSVNLIIAKQEWNENHGIPENIRMTTEEFSSSNRFKHLFKLKDSNE